jgi:hypothetical protein
MGYENKCDREIKRRRQWISRFDSLTCKLIAVILAFFWQDKKETTKRCVTVSRAWIDNDVRVCMCVHSRSLIRWIRAKNLRWMILFGSIQTDKADFSFEESVLAKFKSLLFFIRWWPLAMCTSLHFHLGHIINKSSLLKSQFLFRKLHSKLIVTYKRETLI